VENLPDMDRLEVQCQGWVRTQVRLRRKHVVRNTYRWLKDHPELMADYPPLANLYQALESAMYHLDPPADK
jgi:hypothetical protein